MTEQQWMSSASPSEMLEWWNKRQASAERPIFPSKDARKLRLFAAQCYRMATSARTLKDEGVMVAERWAETGEPPPDERNVRNDWAINMADAAEHARAALQWSEMWDKRAAEKAALMRDLFGNPFRPFCWCGASTGCDPNKCHERKRLLTPQVVSLAAAAYGEGTKVCKRCRLPGWEQSGRGLGKVAKRSSRRLVAEMDDTRLPDGSLDPFLLALVADALEEAGTSEPCIHCQGKGYHQTGLVRCDGEGIHDSRAKIGCIACEGSGYMTHSIVAHLRSPGPHVRGCWATDPILGRS